jgi:hypothetical protein
MASAEQGACVVPESVFSPNSDEVSGGWSKLHSKELYTLHHYYITSDSTVLVRTLAASRRCRVLIKALGRTPLDSDQPVAKVSIYIGQHNTETQSQTSMPRAGFELTISIIKRPGPTS